MPRDAKDVKHIEYLEFWDDFFFVRRVILPVPSVRNSAA